MTNSYSKKNNNSELRVEPFYRLSGITIQYYYACKRELWFHLHFFDPPHEHQHLSLGRLVHQTSYKNRGKKSLTIGEAVIDFITTEEGQILVTEIKKSSKLVEPAAKQLLYYLLLLKRQGIRAKGIIRIPKERKTIRLTLTQEIEKELIEAEKDSYLIARSHTPPPAERKPYCKSCAYKEFCEA